MKPVVSESIYSSAQPLTILILKMPSSKSLDKPDIQADVIIGADGLNSICREQLLGKSDPSYKTGDVVYRLTVKVSDM